MKALKYILHVLIFMVIYSVTMFVAPSLASTRWGVCVVLGVVTALELAYVWFVAKGRYFSVPLSIMVIMLLGMFYFNHPANHDMRLGMWVLARFLVLPYAIGSFVVAFILHKAAKFREKYEWD